MSGTVHVVGAGLAGLSAAFRLAEQGRRVVLYDAAKQAGGRCRSYEDGQLGLTIDNGNHLILSGNRSALDFARRIGGAQALSGPSEARFDFADLRSGERWTLRMNDGRLPWWILDRGRRVPGTRARDYLAPLGILRAGADATIGEAMTCAGTLYDRLWHPVLLAALNTEVPACSARLAATLLKETLCAGGAACRPIIAAGGLSAAFVDPALDRLLEKGSAIRLGTRLRAIAFDGDRAAALDFGEERVGLGPQDSLVLAVPAPLAASLVPGLIAPDEFRAIANAHFRILPPPGQPVLVGIVGGVSEWLFAYPDRLSVTISAADHLIDRPREDLARTIWSEVAQLTGLPADMPPWQIVKEKRATFAATPAQDRRRPDAATRWNNLVLAGDWTQTGLPATIEGTIRSGYRAAALVAASPHANAVETVS